MRAQRVEAVGERSVQADEVESRLPVIADALPAGSGDPRHPRDADPPLTELDSTRPRALMDPLRFRFPRAIELH